MAPILGYLNIRGLAQPVRFLLEYVGEGYDEKWYEFGPAPEYDRSSWTNVKYTLDLQLPNLPYYIDGDTKLTQSYAIMRHLGRKYDLCGHTEKEMALNDMLMDQGRDMRMQFARLCYFSYSPESKKEYLEKLQLTLKSLSAILGKKAWFCGDKITLADFVLYEELDVNLALDSKSLDGFQNIKDFLKRFEGLPAIRNFMSSSRFIKKKINAPMAKFHSIK